MNSHQKKQIEVINNIEDQINKKDLKFSTVTPIENYESDPRICLTGVHFPSQNIINKINQTIIKPLKEIEAGYYYYPDKSFHLTIKNIKIIHDPPNFDNESINKTKTVFSSVIPLHKKFFVYFYRLLLFPNNLALIGTTDPELDNIHINLDKKLKEAGIADDKKYSNKKYFFCNITLARFNKSSEKFKNFVIELSKNISLGPYLIDSVSLVSGNAVLKKCKKYGTWKLNGIQNPKTSGF